MCGQFEDFRGDGSKNCYSDMIRVLFTAYMECADDVSSIQISALISRLQDELIPELFIKDSKFVESSDSYDQERSMSAKRKTRENSIVCDFLEINADDSAVRTLILHLHNDYPGDPGSLCPLLLNCLNLAEGEAFFMGSNEPHAYISGTIYYFSPDL